MLFEEEEEIYPNTSRGVRIPKNENYSEIIVPRFSDSTFRQHFRMKPDVFEALCGELYSMDQPIHGPGRARILIEKQLMITLWYLGNPECMRSIADRFGICIASTTRVVSRTCDLLMQLNRTHRFIRWPTTEEAAGTAAYYEGKTRLKGVIGSIDGSHIRIRSPVHSPNSYINRKGFHSVLLQGICNQKMEFLHCYTGEAGSNHDAVLLRRSGLENKILSGTFPVNEEQHLLGDSAYPLKKWLVTPYKDNGHLRDQHRIFNKVHSKCRTTIERTFGLLKGRFRRLFYIDSLKPTNIVKYIMTACILHNICIQKNDVDDGMYVPENADSHENNNEDDSMDTETGHSKRESLLNSLF